MQRWWGSTGFRTRLFPFPVIYLYHITNGISNRIRLFADNTSLFATIDEIIQETLSVTNDLDTTEKNGPTYGL